MHVVYLHSEDLDGWLAAPNRTIPQRTLGLLASLQGLALENEGGRHEIQIVLNSGKPPEYLRAEADRFGGTHVIAGNGAAWQSTDGAVRRVVPVGKDLPRLRQALGLDPFARDVVRLRLPGGSAEVALEDKRDAEGDIGLSFFPWAEPVSHRWRFVGGIEPHDLALSLRALVARLGLALSVPEPHPDGAVDVLPLLNGRPVGKWTLPMIARELYPDADLRLSHGGDGSNDLSAFDAEGVLPMTASNCVATRAAVLAGGGIVAQRPAPTTAFAECYRTLAGRGFYGPLSVTVSALCRVWFDQSRRGA